MLSDFQSSESILGFFSFTVWCTQSTNENTLHQRMSIRRRTQYWVAYRIDITGTDCQNKGYNIVKILLSVVTRTDVERVFVNVDVRCAGVARPYDGEAREVVRWAARELVPRSARIRHCACRIRNAISLTLSNTQTFSPIHQFVSFPRRYEWLWLCYRYAVVPNNFQ